MVERIALTGPESTGKTTLAQQLAKHYRTLFVPEIARSYIDQLGRSYEEKDLKIIAMHQCAEEDRLVSEANRFLICDTDLLVIKIWSEYKYHHCDEWITDQLKKRKPRLYLLCNIDLDWEFDPQREHPDRREELFNLYHAVLIKMKCNYEIISGKKELRLQRAINAINTLK